MPALLVTALMLTQAQANPLSAGRLICQIGAGAGIGLGAYRQVQCSFERPHQVAERYEGYTGIVTAPAAGGDQSIAFAVDMPRPDAPAALGGDYAGRGFGRYGSSAALVGGDGDAIALTPVNSAAMTSLAPLNETLGVSQLHLNYAGRLRPTR